MRYIIRTVYSIIQLAFLVSHQRLQLHTHQLPRAGAQYRGDYP